MATLSWWRKVGDIELPSTSAKTIEKSLLRIFSGISPKKLKARLAGKLNVKFLLSPLMRVNRRINGGSFLWANRRPTPAG
jgi:hypothetical protein